jgi:drug/metabolite transporter (DMT)-like permease
MLLVMTLTQRHRAFGAWILVCIFWSTTFLAIRIGVQELPPLGMISGTRYIVAGLILAAIVTSLGVALPSRDSLPGHAVLGFLMLGLGNGALVWAEQWVPSGMAAVMVAAIPFWMLGIEALLPSGERVHPAQVAGLLLGFAGLVLLATANSTPAGATGRQFLQGAIAVQVSCGGWALGSAYSKRHARHENVFAAAAVQMVLGGLMLLAAGTALGEWHAFHPTMRGMLAWGYLVAFGALVGYASYVYALKYLPVATVSLYAYITPVLAVVLGALVMNEPFTPRMAIAIVIIFTGMLVVRRSADTSRS